ncbi:MAG: two-component regulator propeller domain-containing protein [Bacteroidota bacterium]
MIFRSLFSLYLLLFCFFASAQTYIGQREIVSYEKQQYNAGAQNWAIRQDTQGRIYFANNEGLLSFDGIYWKLYPLANRTIVRSLEFGTDNRIYIGGQDEIGYFAPDNTGKLTYTSLKDLLPEADRAFADIWDITSYAGSIFFRSNNKMFRYADNKMMVFKPHGSGSGAWLFMGLNKDQLIAQDQQLGLLEFKNGNWTPLIGKDLLPPGFDITDITHLNKDSCLIVTQDNGMYVLANGKIEPFQLSGIEMDPHQILSKSVKIDEDNFIVGTYNNGFYLISNTGVVIENFSGKEGLQNSNVRSLFYDNNHNIWLGLDSGIDFIAYKQFDQAYQSPDHEQRWRICCSNVPQQFIFRFIKPAFTSCRYLRILKT